MTEGTHLPARTEADRYVVLREIGRGGMATVHLARDLQGGGLVALKTLREDIASSVNTERFLREVTVAGALVHPRIVALLDVGRTEDGLPFYVMPYVEGETLRQRLTRERQLPIDEAVAIVREIADALAFAHEQGVLHRDVTPANILLSADGAWLTDFGIARALGASDDETLTSTGIVIGTPEYMSPEQGAGDHGMDQRGDLFSLASVLYTALAGEAPYTGPSAQAVLARKATARAPSVHELRPTVPAHVARAIARSLEPAPADRFRTVREFDVALGTPDVARASAPRTTRRWLIAAGVVAAGAVVAVVSVRRGGVSAARKDLEAGRISAGIEKLRVVVARDSSDGEAALWLAQGLVLSGADTGTEFVRLARIIGTRTQRIPSGSADRARGLVALAAHDFDMACSSMRADARRWPADLISAFNLATCLSRDAAVVTNAKSPSGFSFRTSWDEVVRLDRDLLERLPRGHESRPVVLRKMPAVLRTEFGRYRRGVAAGDSTLAFGAFPELLRGPAGDTISYVPHPISEFRTGQSWMNPKNLAPAVERDRSVLREIGAAWSVDEPDVAESHAAYALGLELTGDISGPSPESPSAIREITIARRLARTADEDLSMRVVQIRLWVKLGWFEEARALADSTLARWPSPKKAVRDRLFAMAALTGRGHALSALLLEGVPEFEHRMPDGHSFRPHPVLAGIAIRFAAYAVVGGPRDSLLGLRESFERSLRSYASAQARDSIRTALFSRYLNLSVPVLGPSVVLGQPASLNLTGMQQALARRDFAGLRRLLAEARMRRSSQPTGGVPIEQVYHESWLRTAIADTSGAIEQMDDALDGLPARGTLFLSTMTEAGALGRLMLFRAAVATALRDSTTAARWNRAAQALLLHADPALPR